MTLSLPGTRSLTTQQATLDVSKVRGTAGKLHGRATGCGSAVMPRSFPLLHCVESPCCVVHFFPLATGAVMHTEAPPPPMSAATGFRADAASS